MQKEELKIELGTIFGRDDYSRAYTFAEENGYDIKQVGIGFYQLVEKQIISEPTKEEFRAMRASAYAVEVDPFMAEYQRKLLFNLFEDGEEETLKAEIQSKVAEIKERYPYPVEDISDTTQNPNVSNDKEPVTEDETEYTSNKIPEAEEAAENDEKGDE